MTTTEGSTFDFFICLLRDAFINLPDKRRGKNTQYTLADAAMSAFSVFFTQEPSFLSYQKRMQQKYGTSNAKAVFSAASIPSDTQIRRLLDTVPTKTLNGVFWDSIAYVKQAGKLEQFRTTVGNKDILVALDGTWYFSSHDIHCGNCLKKNYEGELIYYHAMINPVIAVPGKTQVLALPPEFIKNTDGEKKQDCEQNGAKRWIRMHGKRLSRIGVTILGDDLYSHEPICRELLVQSFNFILVCKEESHKTVYEWIKGITEEVRVEKVTGVRKVKREIWVYRFVNGVPLKDGPGALLVNWCEITMLNEKGERKYHNAFVTNHQITSENVAEITSCGRARWKVENENNNTLKNQGYHLEHNFGHGKKYLASLLALLNILAFGFHTILEIMDQSYQAAREKVGRRDELFNGIRTLLSLFPFSSFHSLLEFMLGHKQTDLEHLPIPI
jgi:hypothetical protein